MKILQWLGRGHGVGESSKAIALTALGEMPVNSAYPHDGDDFGRCYQLLVLCPDAQAGLDRLGKDGGPMWQALVPRWNEIRDAWLHDKSLSWPGDKDKYKCYDLMRSILRPVEDASGRVVRGKDFSIHI